MLAVAHVLGLLLAAFAATYLLPAACALWFGDGMLRFYLLAAALSAGAGLLLAGLTEPFRRELKPRDGFLLITLAWLLLPAAAALPLRFALRTLSFSGAYFEAMSGLTTTGSTVLGGLDALPPSLNFWRHALHWFGGLGILVMALAVLPLLKVGGMQVYKAEATGAMKDERLAPRIAETAKSLWLVYALLTAAGIVALRLSGMSWFDAVCHAFSAVGLGGFSTHDRSIAWFDSPAVELVLVGLMVIAALNFARHLLAVRMLSFEPYRTDPESQAVLRLLGLSVLGIALLLHASGVYPEWPQALRHALFNVVSQATTSGLTTQDYQSWPAFAPWWLLFLSCVVCSSGSSGGGIKMFRTLLLARHAGREMKLLIHPAAVAPVRIGGRAVPEAVGHGVLAFIFIYFISVIGFTFALLLSGLGFEHAVALAVSSINNTAHGFGAPGAVHNLQSLTTPQIWLCTAAMLLGRLEIFSVVVLLRPAYWRK
ncbi:MAG: TrkH family potassium uptake protein [Gammaproteobacteria bacterium]|nr:TrkH family potassium uptake protein [Gammaproteobacteria bacterium]MBV9622325.1 TrkH family potassium uptake protein [Gammaproteobacteria bacterium]